MQNSKCKIQNELQAEEGKPVKNSKYKMEGDATSNIEQPTLNIQVPVSQHLTNPPHPLPLATPREHLIRPPATFSPSDAEKGTPMGEGGVGLFPFEVERVKRSRGLRGSRFPFRLRVLAALR